MKKLLLPILILLSVPIVTMGALTPVSWIRDTVAGFVRPGITTDTLRIPSLTNCDTIDTDSDGDFSCGTDDGGDGVPYTGATANVDLGTYNLTTPRVNGTLASGLTLDGNTNPISIITSGTGSILLDSEGDGGYANLDTSLISSTKIFSFPDLDGTFALLANKISDFASTASSELASVLSDETGTGEAVFADSPVFTTRIFAPLITANDSGGLSIEANNNTDVGILGVGNTANVTWYGTHVFDALTASKVAVFGGTKNLTSDTGSDLSVSGTSVSVVSATTSTAGKVELATISETNTGTDTDRAITPDALAGSVFGVKNLDFYILDASYLVTTGDGKMETRIPPSLNGMNITGVSCNVLTTSSSGTPTIQLARGRQSSATSAHSFVDVLSTRVTIDASEYDSKDATTASVVNTSNDDVATGDVLRFDVDVTGTGTRGLICNVELQLP